MKCKNECNKASYMRHRVTLQEPTLPSDGEPAPTAWTSKATLWGRVEASAGNEQNRGDQMQSLVNYTVTIRYRPDVTPRMRFKFGTTFLNVRAVFDPTGDRDILRCQCVELD